MDDLILGGTDLKKIKQRKILLNDKSNIKGLRVLNYFLDFEVARTKNGISLCQRKYSLDLIHDESLIGAKPCNTSMQPHLQIHKTPLSEPTTYKGLIDILLYHTHSMHEITYAVRKPCQFLDASTDKHILVGLHVLRYLKNNPRQGLFFSSSSTPCLKDFFDSDWGACPDTRRSTTGICFFLSKSLINYKSKKLAVVSQSSSDTEYRALTHAICKGQWFFYLLNKF